MEEKSLQYGCVDGHSWLEWDDIVVGCGAYLLINNDGGGGCRYVYSSWSVVKPDGDDEGSSEKDCTWK